MNKYFVILNHYNGMYLPMVDDNDALEMFETEALAITAGNNNPLGFACGFEVFELGGGVF